MSKVNCNELSKLFLISFLFVAGEVDFHSCFRTSDKKLFIIFHSFRNEVVAWKS